tara:strand:+ start:3509 stop:3649 length:141 start_codon:yes stop_codon:yes gene_type:complete
VLKVNSWFLGLKDFLGKLLEKPIADFLLITRRIFAALTDKPHGKWF